MNRYEPPSCGSALVLIGQNSCGQWVAQEQSGRFGGLFKARCDAVRYALFENGHHPDMIVETAGVIELDMSAVPFAAPQRTELLQRRVA